MDLTVLDDKSELIRYPNVKLPIYLERGTLSSFTNLTAVCHWHEDVEFLVPLTGHLTYCVNGKTIELSAEQALFVNALQLHYGFSSDGSDCSYLCITVRPEVLAGSTYIYDQYVQPILRQTERSFFLFGNHEREHRKLIQTLKRANIEFNQKRPGYEISTIGILVIAWQQLYAIMQPFLDLNNSDDPKLEIQKRMLNFIHKNYQQHITLDQIARAGEVCRSNCCIIFRKFLNKGPNEYLNLYRIEQAAKLLRQTNMSITEVAYCCGFSSSSYFSENFLKQKGITPSMFRKISYDK